MRRLIFISTLFLALLIPVVSHAVDCAFEDVNDNGVFDGGDIITPDASWLGGVPFVTVNPWVVPVGCDKTLLSGPAVTSGVVVNAGKITFNARLDYLPPGGKGVVLVAVGDLNVGDGLSPAVIRAGGFNGLPANSVALFHKSIALSGGGTCHFNIAEIRGNVPNGSTGVGILCGGDLVFRGTQVVGSRINIQSLNGKIDASNGAGGGGGLLSLASLCDNPGTNLDGNGNNNGVADAADFPCSLNLGGVVQFADLPSLQAACTPFSIQPGNQFRAFNDPAVFIAGAGNVLNTLDLRGASVVGKYRVTLAAEDASILTQDAVIDNGEQLGINPPGGARVWVFADPTSITRLPVDREDFAGPSAGSTFIENACYRSPNNINVGRDAANGLNLVGNPAPAPCAQLADFVGVLNGNF
jgi:hypothetical protein